MDDESGEQASGRDKDGADTWRSCCDNVRSIRISTEQQPSKRGEGEHRKDEGPSQRDGNLGAEQIASGQKEKGNKGIHQRPEEKRQYKIIKEHNKQNT